MLSKRYTRTQAYRLLARRYRRIQNSYIASVEPVPFVWKLTVLEAAEMLASRYRTAGVMSPAQLQHRLNLWAETLQKERMHVFFHVEGAHLPSFTPFPLSSAEMTTSWIECEAQMNALGRLREELLGI